MIKSLVPLALLGTLLAVVGCEQNAANTPATGPAVPVAVPVTLQLNWKPEPQFGGFYEALRSGAFASRNLDVSVVPGGAGAPTVQLLAAGQVQFAIVSGDQLVLARAGETPIDLVALFAVYQTNPQGIMVRSARGLASIDEVFARPGTLAIERGLAYAQYLEQKFGFDKLNVVKTPFGDLTGLRTVPDYAMQCFITSEPISATNAGLDVQTFLIADAGWNPYTTVVAARRDFVEQNAGLVSDFLAAVREGWTAYLDDPEPTNAVMHALEPTMDRATMTASAAAQIPLIRTSETATIGIGGMTAARWQTLIDQMSALRLITRPIAGADLISP